MFFKASVSSACVGELSKQRAELLDTKASRRHYANRKSTKLKYENPKRRIIHPNTNSKGIVCDYYSKKEAKCKGQLLVDYGMMR